MVCDGVVGMDAVILNQPFCICNAAIISAIQIMNFIHISCFFYDVGNQGS